MTKEPLRKPNFLIIGAGKSGTTSLGRYLSRHPDVFMPSAEEPKYFAFRQTKPNFCSPDAAAILKSAHYQPKDYYKLFTSWQAEKVGGEKSAYYLSAPKAAKAIHEEIPDAKLIVIFRNPADRAFSHFNHNLRSLREPLHDFRAALAAERERTKLGWSYNFWYRERGRYAKQLKRYLDLFNEQQLLILLYDDLVVDTAAVMRRVCQFLGIDEHQDLQVNIRHNVSEGVPKNPYLHLALTKNSLAKTLFKSVTSISLQNKIWWLLYRRNLDPLPTFDPELRQELLMEFRPEILELEQLIKRDLSNWLKAKAQV